jgi:3-hydroxyacyl-[acyl-carrier-protein] dehydratase
LIVEAMAQAGCVYFYYSKNLQGKSLIYYLAKIEARFHHPVVPGDRMTLEVSSVKLLPMAGFVKCKALVGEKLMAEAEIGFGIKEA